MKKEYTINCTHTWMDAPIIRDVASGSPYIVLVRDQCGRCHKVCFDTSDGAEAAAKWFRRGYEFVEVLKGHDGNWESVSRSW